MKSKRAPLRRGFTLIEILVVLAIIALITALMLPSFKQMIGGSNMRSSEQAVIDTLKLARQTALTRNLPVEVRFFKLPPDESPTSTPDTYRAFQTFLLESNQSIPLVKPFYFPPQIVFSPDPKLSSLLDSGHSAESSERARLEPFGLNYSYCSFRFKPNGETDLKNTPMFITLALQSDLDRANRESKVPRNFTTIQIDSLNGQIRVFRP